MATKLPNYLRTHRKRLSLTQDQVAFLLGVRSGTKVSRLECNRREPNLRTAMALEVIYHRPLCELFAGLYEEVERHTEGRAHTLAARLAAAPRGRRFPKQGDGKCSSLV